MNPKHFYVSYIHQSPKKKGYGYSFALVTCEKGLFILNEVIDQIKKTREPDTGLVLLSWVELSQTEVEKNREYLSQKKG